MATKRAVNSIWKSPFLARARWGSKTKWINTTFIISTHWLITPGDARSPSIFRKIAYYSKLLRACIYMYVCVCVWWRSGCPTKTPPARDYVKSQSPSVVIMSPLGMMIRHIWPLRHRPYWPTYNGIIGDEECESITKESRVTRPVIMIGPRRCLFFRGGHPPTARHLAYCALYKPVSEVSTSQTTYFEYSI